jgi:hypothetical protein
MVYKIWFSLCATNLGYALSTMWTMSSLWTLADPPMVAKPRFLSISPYREPGTPVAFPIGMSYPFVRNPTAPVPKPSAGKGLRVGVSALIALAALVASGIFSGCYTQLYTRGYAQRPAAYPEYSRAPRAPADTTAPDTGTAGDSGVAGPASGGDTLYRPPATVIVNNYYRESPYYRGYLINDWDYPSFSFGIYSTRYRDYSSPFWWNDPWYRAGGGYHTGYHGGYRSGNDGNVPPAGGGGSTGPYQSDKRIFTPAPDYPELRKGRRAYEAPATEANPAPKYSSESGSSAASNPPSSSSTSSSGSAEPADHPTLKKGKRR